MTNEVVNKDPIKQRDSLEKENISQKVDQIGERIKEKLDWREYVKESPYLAIVVLPALVILAQGY